MGCVAVSDRRSQQLGALERANAVRVERARWLREVRALGAQDAAREVADLLSDPPAAFSSMLVWTLLSDVWRGGPAGRKRTEKAKRLMIRTKVSSWTLVGGLTDRQREALATELRLLAGRVAA